MKITGAYLYTYTKKKIGMAYTGYFSAAQFNQFFEDAMISAIERRYQSSQDMKFKDEMSSFIKTNVLIQNIGQNSINLRPIAITNLDNFTGNFWRAEMNIPFAPQNVNAVIDIQGVTGFTNNPNGLQTITSITNTVKGAVEIFFTATAYGAGSYTMNSGYFSFQNTNNLVANQLIDYIHLLNIKCKFSQPLDDLHTISSTNGTPVVVQLNYYNKLRSSNWKDNPVQIGMSGWALNTSANGTFYVKKINNLQFALYSDVYLQNPVAGVANETNSSVALTLVYYNNASKYISTQKANSLITPTWDKPGYERAGSQLNIYPMNIYSGVITTPCTEVTLDYICNPQLPYLYSPQNDVYSGTYVDANDNLFDVSTIYGEKFPFSVCDDVALFFVESTRDMNLNEIAVETINRNP